MSPEDSVRSDDGLILYDYWRSTAAYRVRIVLNLKGLEYTQRPVNLVKAGGEQHSEAYKKLNPQGLVPALVHNNIVITQSFAICEYLDSVFPQYALFPDDPYRKSLAQAMALTVACDIHPLNNLRVQQYLKGQLSVSSQDAVTWMHHWMLLGFESIEAQLQAADLKGKCCLGDQPGIVDCFLIPQVYNAERFDCDLSRFPAIRSISAYCNTLPAFIAAMPANQADVPAD
ncbi:MAG: maleylacetoacetate isomerase [Lysobacterales bacterium]|jgi:maleylacetoacetate isomerase